ncbi:periplasmic/secreted protein [Actinobacillus equuli]|nr:periplasmic/secreted protein [Actinobacillus equuli]
MEGALAQCSRAVLNPPAVFLRDYIGIDPYNTVAFTFADHPFNSIGVTHMIFSLVFAIGYCLVAEVFPKIKFWQGIGAGIIAISVYTTSHSGIRFNTTCCRMAFIRTHF